MSSSARAPVRSYQELNLYGTNLNQHFEAEIPWKEVGTRAEYAIQILDSDDEFHSCNEGENDDITYSPVVASDDDDSMSQDSHDSIETIEAIGTTTHAVTAPADEEFPVFPGEDENDFLFGDLDSLLNFGESDCEFESDIELHQEQHDHTIYHQDFQEQLRTPKITYFDKGNCPLCFQNGQNVEADLYCRHCSFGFCYPCTQNKLSDYHCTYCGHYLN